MVVVGSSAGVAPASYYAPILKRRYAPETVTLVTDSTPTFAVSDCFQRFAYGQVTSRVGGCGLLPTHELRDQCLSDETVDVVASFDAIFEQLGPEALHLDVSSKSDDFNRENLAVVGVTSLEFSTECRDAFLFETAEAYHAQLGLFAEVVGANNPQYQAFFLDSRFHQYLQAGSAATTLGVIQEVANPFAAFENATAPIFVGTTIDGLFNDFLPTIDAASLDGSGSGPGLAAWLRSAVLTRFAASECNGDVARGENPFLGDLETCAPVLAGRSYDAARSCDTTADCPTGLTCFQAQPSGRRSLRFGAYEGAAGRCRREPLLS